MKQRLTALLVAGVLLVLLAGCGGGIGLGTLLSFLDAGDLIASIAPGLFPSPVPGVPETQTATVYLDGQPITEIDADDTQVKLEQLPEGRHRLHVVASDYRGASTLVTIRRGDPFNADISPFTGGHIEGRVRLEESDGTRLAAGRAQVYAIPDGQVELHTSSTIQLPGDMPPYAAYTDTAGNYNLRALEPTTYLVIATVAGYMADMVLVDVQEEMTNTVDLTLHADPEREAGRVSGVVQTRFGAGLANASLRAQLDAAPYVPNLHEDTVDRIQDEAGIATLPQLRFNVLATLTRSAGNYRLPLTAGTVDIEAFKLNHRPIAREVTVVGGEQVSADFRLEEY